MIFTVLTIFCLIGLLSYYIIFSRIKLSSFDLENNQFSEGISIVICAKNELENIKSFFPSWINQDYPNFELIVVNDQSTDESSDYLNQLETQYSNVKIISIPQGEKKELQGKRHALWQGIKASKYEYLFFTDADCEPKSKYWLRDMSKAFANKNTEIVLGYSPYFEEKTLLNQLIQYETFITALQYLSFAEIGFPYMSVGRNVAYKKAILTEKAFKNSNHSVGGDDDLVFQQIATKENVAYSVSTQTQVLTVPPKRFKEWILQKKRHLGAGLFYPSNIKVALGLFGILNILFFIFIAVLALKNPLLSLFLFTSKYLMFNLLIYKNSLKSISLFQFLKFYTLIDIVYWLFYIIFGIVLIF